ncbi:DUF86 domain-containing protein [Candidatus Woesearchaeota archaeon]|nr:DUF86 domain-containing protein [Candidatus Woesearchaeota archaeon]
MTNHEDLPYIQHIRDAIRYIENFIKGLTKDKFFKDKLRQSAVVRQLEIIGEATKNVSTKFRDKYLEVEWRKMAGTRDRVSHAYFDVNLEIVWSIIEDDLPKLKKQIKKILEKELKNN